MPHERPITALRRRLRRLMHAQCAGQYTRLARRAGIPVSSMEHIMLTAKRLPGGDQLLRLAAALGVTVQALVTGEAAGRPAGRLARPVPGLRPGGEPPAPPTLTLPVFRCGCPAACPLMAEVPPEPAARSTLLLAADLVARHRGHRLLAIQIDPGLPCAEWPAGARLVVDWDARTPQWEALALIHTEGRCQLGHLSRIEHLLFFASRVDGDVRVIEAPWKILGTIVAAVTPL